MLSGESTLGGQKHFYMETNAAVAEPTEAGGMVVTCGHQNPGLTQASVAAALGVPLSNVDVRLRRVGGAYGGKLNAHLPTAVLAAVAAHKHRLEFASPVHPACGRRPICLPGPSEGSGRSYAPRSAA